MEENINTSNSPVTKFKNYLTRVEHSQRLSVLPFPARYLMISFFLLILLIATGGIWYTASLQQANKKTPEKKTITSPTPKPTKIPTVTPISSPSASPTLTQNPTATPSGIQRTSTITPTTSPQPTPQGAPVIQITYPTEGQ